MTLLPSIILPAAAEGGVVFIIVVIISLISWVINLFQGNNPKGPKPNRPRPNQGQSDLEKFLQEVVGNKPQAQAEAERPRPAPPRPPKQANQKKPAKQKPPIAQRPVTPPRTDRPGARLQQTHLASTGLGDGVRSHVAGHMEPRVVDAAVAKDVDNAVRRDIDAAVQRDIGADGTITGTVQRPIHPMVRALRNPDGVRQAIMLSEILNRPKSLR